MPIELIIALATIGVPGVGALVGFPLYFSQQNRKYNRREEERLQSELQNYQDKYEEAKNFLVDVVSGVSEHSVYAQLDKMRTIISAIYGVRDGMEASRWVVDTYGDRFRFIALTHTYKTENGLSSPIAELYRKKSDDTPTDFEDNLAVLSNIHDGLALTDASEETLKEVREFAREYASHLLLNFRPSLAEVGLPSRDKMIEGVRRQVALNEKGARIANNLTNPSDKTAFALSALERGNAEAREIASRQKMKAVTGANKTTRELEGSKKAPTQLEQTTQSEGLTDLERAALEKYQLNLPLLSEEDKMAGQNAVQKLGDAVTHAMKAEKFSAAVREQALLIAEQNRGLAIAELNRLSDTEMSKEEAETLYALRVDNKYLVARYDEQLEEAKAR